MSERDRNPSQAGGLGRAAHRWFGKAPGDLDAAERLVLAATVERSPVSRDANETFDDRQTFGQKLADRVAAFERQAIDQALRAAGGDIALAMATLDLPRRTLNEKMARYGLERTQYLRK